MKYEDSCAIAYQRLGSYMSVFFLGKPTPDDLRNLIKDAADRLAAFEACLKTAEEVLAGTREIKSIRDIT